METAERSSCRLPYPSAQPLYAAAERWRDEALIGDRSLFDGRALDVQSAGRELVDYFVNNVDEGTGTFLDKLRAQLATVSADAVQVAAELLYVHFLIVSTDAVSSSTKLKIINGVLQFRPSEVGSIPDELAQALRGGAAHPGQAFNNYRWKMFAFLINFFVEVKSRPVDQRRAVLTDRAQLKDVFARLDQQTVWSQMWAVEHMLFPDLTPPMLNRDDRAAVVARWPELGEEVSEVLTRLAPNGEYGDRRAVLPYRTPYREQWKGTDPAIDTYVDWAIRVLETGDQYQEEIEYKRDNAVRIREAIRARGDVDGLHEALRAVLTHKDFNLVHHYVVDDFLKWVASEPRVAGEALDAFDTFRGAEAIDGFLQHVPRNGQLSGLGGRLSLASAFVMATDPSTWPPYRDRPAKTTARLTKGYRAQESATAGEHYLLFLERLDLIGGAMARADRPLDDRLGVQSLAWLVAEWGDLPGWDPATYQAFDAWRTGKEVPTPQAPDPLPAQSAAVERESASSLRTLEDLAAELSFAEEDHPWLEETIALLRDKRQIVFQGPPGTGKTYMARALGEFVTGSAGRVDIVQFHPSYAYEDFVTGLRPDPALAGHFTLVPGPLVRIAERARAHPDDQFVLLIDEINRANVPAVFGELYYLLEYRDQDITMTYGEESFSLPSNLFIIGTMNTADRSITTLDSAMRRRFYVRDLRPGERPLDGILRTHLTSRAPDLEWLADVLDLVNDVVGDRDLAIGPSFFMGDPPTEQRARRAWDNSVLPTLRETFYSRPTVLEGLEFTALKDQVTGTVTDDAAD
ncbi:McrB family protein [Ornithinimicrobium sp. LYQ103]|uniref:McrB family protein n=1 Tax=Ornithinimicrobium sp. LYQ103 TaxID=3378796 RepID=UPI0038539670